MTATTAMQREAVRLAAILVTVLTVLSLGRLRLRRTASDEGRQTAISARFGLLHARLRLAIALLARLRIVALYEGLRILWNVRLRLARAECLFAKRLGVVIAIFELLVGARLELLVVAAFGARLEVGILLPELLLRGGDQAKIMLGVLEIIFGGNRIAGGLGIARKLKIFFGHVIGRSANLHIRAVRLINPGEGVLIAPVVVLLIIVAPAHALVVIVMMLLTVSHGLLFNDS